MICTSCGEDKALTSEFFHKKKSSRTGYSLVCKVCIAQDGKEYRAKNGETIRAKKKAAAQTPHGKQMHNANNARWRAKHPDYFSTYQEENAEAIAITKRAYRQAHPDEERERALQWVANNPEKRKAIVDRYYANHPEECHARTLAWQAAHPEAFLAIARNHTNKRRALQAGSAVNDFTTPDFDALCVAFHHRCAYCEEELPLTPDHFIPLTKGGLHTKANIVPACLDCNRQKNDRMPTSPMPQPGDPPAWPTFELYNYRHSKKPTP